MFPLGPFMKSTSDKISPCPNRMLKLRNLNVLTNLTECWITSSLWTDSSERVHSGPPSTNKPPKRPQALDLMAEPIEVPLFQLQGRVSYPLKSPMDWPFKAPLHMGTTRILLFMSSDQKITNHYLWLVHSFAITNNASVVHPHMNHEPSSTSYRDYRFTPALTKRFAINITWPGDM